MRNIFFENSAFKDFTEWGIHDRKLQQRIAQLILEITRTPFEGKGKPEPLKHIKGGYWSRRINDEHRLVCKVTEEAIIIVSCKYHYDLK
ncbi:MAG: Txe/YoeB family addiction module toxin [Ignavibacteriae bacterium]|nr:Txe/YoeB family addiction module toxin [Ignavibacteriota bacterium]